MTASAQTASEKATAKVQIRFNGKPAQATVGATVLQAARGNGVRIPTLCHLPGQQPYGGCRLCLVEIEGRPGYFASCVLRVEQHDEGMNVLTDTDTVKALRKEVFRLLLSEHPTGCLLCEEGGQCRESINTIRKSGYTTGCRFCSNDGACEIQALVEELGIADGSGIGFAVRYRNVPVEREEPFYDRDYNLCVLCGRCVRACADIGADVLTFVRRGPDTLVGAGLNRTHLEADCWFCGTCVLYCPTGTLSDRHGKWDGDAATAVKTVCPLCELGCKMKLDIHQGKAVRSTPVVTERVCAKGRYALPGLISGPGRLQAPMARRLGAYAIITWEEAFRIAAEKIGQAAVSGAGGFAMLAAPELMGEARKLVAAAAYKGQASLDTSARLVIGGSGALATSFKTGADALAAIDAAQVVLMVAAEPRFSHTPLLIAARRAQRRGAKLVVVDARRTSLARRADVHVSPGVGREAEALAAIIKAVQQGSGLANDGDSGAALSDLQEAARLLDTGPVAAVVGASPLGYANQATYIDALKLLGEKAALIPYLFPSTDPEALQVYGPVEVADLLSGKARPDLLYLAADAPFVKRPECGFLIVQDTRALPEALEADLVLPATAFQVPGASEGEEGARSDAAVLAGVLDALGGAGGSGEAKLDGEAEIARTGDTAAARTESNRPFLLVRDISPFDFRGFGLERAVAGFDRLGLSGVRLHPIDAGRLGVEAGDEIVIAREGAEIRGPAIIDRSIPEHAAYLTVASGAGIPYPFVPGPFAANPCAVEIRRGNPA